MGNSRLEWWLQARKEGNKVKHKAIDSTIMLVSLRIWKLRNDYVFNSTTITTHEAFHLLLEDANLWIQAGASHLVTLGWLTTVTTMR